MVVLIILTIVITLLYYYNPKFDELKNKDVILWYGKESKRKYINLSELLR